MSSQDIIIPVDGSSMPAYLARPQEGSGPHPAVIVLQEVFGFTPETKRVTELLASIGYVGLAINYYHRTNPQMAQPYTEEGVRDANGVAACVTAQNLDADVQSAIAWLNDQPFVKTGKIATWGFDFGANAAFVTADNTQLSGAILFYPTHLTDPMPSGGEPPLDRVADVKVPLLIIFGEQDYYVPRADMDAITQALKNAHKDARVQVYPAVGHAFFRHGRPQAIMELQRYSDEAVAQAVADSWNLVKSFLIDIFNRPARAAETGDIRTERTRTIQARTRR
ncbi:MAG TPA: dienelactone hydrolase family protein [Candidatus Baltobacteraceae bacterium]|nr:dienelactone hydrolase family protein [Candidatus Baltobacteraceae bacterium]